MVAVARIALASVLVSPSLADELAVIAALDAADTTPNPAPTGCTCNVADFCEKHDRVCACSDRFGRCARACETCFGAGVVSVQEACLPQCKRCARLESGVTQPVGLVRG